MGHHRVDIQDLMCYLGCEGTHCFLACFRGDQLFMVALSRRTFTLKDLRSYTVVLELVSDWNPLQDRCLEEDPGQF